MKTQTDKKKPIDRVYYLDMKACLDPEIDRFDAVRSIEPDRKIRSDFGRKVDLDVSTREKGFEALYGFTVLKTISIKHD